VIREDGTLTAPYPYNCGTEICPPVCGDGIVSGGEACDPPGVRGCLGDCSRSDGAPADVQYNGVVNAPEFPAKDLTFFTDIRPNHALHVFLNRPMPVPYLERVPGRPVDIAIGRQLFVDNFLVSGRSGVDIVWHQALLERMFGELNGATHFWPSSIVFSAVRDEYDVFYMRKSEYVNRVFVQTSKDLVVWSSPVELKVFRNIPVVGAFQVAPNTTPGVKWRYYAVYFTFKFRWSGPTSSFGNDCMVWELGRAQF
jgi:hypothetical protein